MFSLTIEVLGSWALGCVNLSLAHLGGEWGWNCDPGILVSTACAPSSEEAPLEVGLWCLGFSLLSQATVLDQWKLDPGFPAFLSDLG